MEVDHNMSETLQYTVEEIAVIDGMIGMIYPRIAEDRLQKSFWILHEHLQTGVINEIDLQRIESALAFLDPGGCTTSHKEDYRGLTSLRLKTQATHSSLAKSASCGSLWVYMLPISSELS